MNRSIRRDPVVWASLLGLFILIGVLVSAAGLLSPWPIYLPGWIVISPVCRQTVRLQNVTVDLGQGWVLNTRRMEVTAAGVRRGSTGIVNKRLLRLGSIVVVQR